MVQPAKSGFWQKCRIGFRRFRITVWLLILALLGAGIYLNQVGLPRFLKQPLLEKLRARGVDLEFDRLRLRWYQGIVAEKVHFGRIAGQGGPNLSVRQVELRLNHRALAKLQLQIDSLVLRQGRLEWAVTQTNGPPRTLAVENIDATLRFLPDDAWALDNFHADFAGADFKFSGTVTNASAIRDWKFLRAEPPVAAGMWTRRLRWLADVLEQIHFSTAPGLRLIFSGDARDLKSFNVHLIVNAPDADTPWGKVTHGVFAARLFPGTSNEITHAELSLRTEEAQTPWARAKTLDLGIRLVSIASRTNLVDVDLDLRAARVETQWANATNAVVAAHWVHSFTNAVPLSGRGDLRLASAETRWGRAKDVELLCRLGTPSGPSPPADATWAWWMNLQPYHLDWECRLKQLESDKLDAREILCAGDWQAPELVVTNLQAELAGGTLAASAHLDVGTRVLGFNLGSDIDAQRISPLLTERAQHWLAKFSWAAPPRIRGGGSLTLPAWTNRQPDWGSEVQPTICLAGEFALTNGAYLGVQANWACSHVTYSNMIWNLPDLRIGRPEGRLDLSERTDDRTRDYHWRVQGAFDVRALRPLLSSNEQHGLDLFTFTQSPLIDGEIWGRFFEYDRIGFQARVALTNFTFRGQTASSFESALCYTNHLLEFFEPRLLRGVQVVSASGVTVDFDAQRVYLTNGFSNTDPLAVARAIGPRTAHAIEPYRFTQPPAARVNGYAPLKSERDADLHFELAGGPFEWWKFKVPHISGDVYWRGETLVLTNVQADFYGGAAAGFAGFNFGVDPGTDFQFTTAVTNANLQLLMADLSPRTNHLEGVLGGRLIITNANSTDWRTWGGSGHVNLRDGLIWDIPVFGILSPVLDTFLPGLGSSRATEGSAQFVITNGAVYSDALEIRSAIMRLQYAGTADLKGRVEARVTANLLRDTWVIGRVISLALWPVSKIFEYKITGTLSQPKSEPVYLIPRLVLMPFHPIRTIEELLPGDPAGTNTPPASSGPAEK